MKRNVNPKTLKGQDKLNRMLDLMGRMKTLNESKSFSELELIKKGPNGVVYGIVRENHDYFIKTSEKTSGKFLAEDFNYIGGLKNKSDEKYSSYSEALKHLNIKFDMLNESYGIESNTNIFESDGRTFGGGFGFGFVMEEEDEETEEKEIISDNDDEIEEQKKVLKVDAPVSDTPVEDEVEDDTDLDMDSDISNMDFGTDTEETDTDTDMDMGDEDEEGDDTTKKIQKYTGKIGQMLRDMDEVDSDLEKYVINSIISAMHLDQMDEGDKEDIISKLEGEEESDFESEESGEDVDLDLDTDLDLDAGEGEETEEESGLTEGKVFSKRQLMESFLRRETKKTLKKVLKERKEICEECMGAGCSVCMDEHHNMSYTNYGKFDRDEYMMDEELIGNQKRIDKNKNGKIDAEDFKMLRKGKRDRRRHIDEEDMSVMDAIETGQGYLPTGDLDRDFDGIPNRLDMDSNSDGELDFSMTSNRYGNDDFIDLDIDFLRNDNPGTKERERTTIKPTTKPGEGDKWRTIKRPKVDPRPKAEDPNMGGVERIKPSYRRRGMFR
jgi:hypothetical protein